MPLATTITKSRMIFPLTGRYAWARQRLLRLTNKVQCGRLSIFLPNGESHVLAGPKDGPKATLRLNKPGALARLLAGGGINFAESYIDGHWDTDTLSNLLEFALLNETAWNSSFIDKPITRLLSHFYHTSRPNTRRGSRQNIAAHYDLGNEFFASWLDETMTYSGGIFLSGEETLKEAQINKFDSLIKALKLSKEHHLLDIGGGWGGFACYAAETIGCQVTTVTISKEQHSFIEKKVRSKALTDRVRVLFQDYRDISGHYDRISVIEMFEAVGEQYWPSFFQRLRHLLKPSGLAILQTIVIRDEIFSAYKNRIDFIQRHIFPGGMLPSREQLVTLTAANGFTWRHDSSYRSDYARTLSMWLSRYENAESHLKTLDLNEQFHRTWRYYLSYCHAGFRTGRTNLLQTLISPHY